jgi:hypothetical protein
MGKTHQQKLGVSRIGIVGRLRGCTAAPTITPAHQKACYMPEDGVLDLSEVEDQHVDPTLVSSIAPIASMYESAEAAAQAWEKAIDSFVQDAAGNTTFLPPEYDQAQPGDITPNAHYVKLVKRPVLEADGSKREPTDEELLNRPLELFSVDSVRDPASTSHWRSTRYCVSHYVYDALSDKWLVANRWGTGNRPKKGANKGKTKLYQQYGATHRRLKDELANEKNADRPRMIGLEDGQKLPRASDERLEEGMTLHRRKNSQFKY